MNLEKLFRIKRNNKLTLRALVRYGAFALAGAAVWDIFPMSASATTPIETDSATYLDNLEVLGTRRLRMSRMDVPIRDLPVTVTSLSLAPLKARGIIDFQTATRYIPSVNTRTTYGAFQQVSIRGFDYSPIEIDEMRDERTTFNSYPLPDLSMVESLEVIKGPASILSGHSSVGGSINIVRKTAGNTPLLELYLSGGSWNTRRISGVIGGALSDNVNTLFSVNRSWGNGWRDRGDRRFSVYNNTTFKIGDRHLFDLRLSYTNDFYGTEAGLPGTMPGDIKLVSSDSLIYREGDMLNGLDLSRRYNNRSDFMYNRNANALFKYICYLPNGWKISNRAMYNHDDIDYFSTETLSYPQSKDPVYPYYYTRGDQKMYIDLDHVQLAFPLRFRHKAQTFQDQLDLNLKFDWGSVKNQMMLGASYTLMDRVSFSGYNVAPSPYAAHFPKGNDDVWGPGVNSVISSYTPDTSAPMYEKFSLARPSVTQVIGVFAQDLIELFPQLKALLAIRYNNYAIRYYKNSEAVDGKDHYKRGENTANLVYNSLTYRVGLVYEPIKELSLYASYANFFTPERRARSFSEKQILIDRNGKVIDQSTLDFKKAVFDPTTGYQAELGTTFRLGDKFEGSLSVYHITQKNLVRTIGTVQGEVKGKPITQSVLAQVGTVLSTGAETSLSYRPVKNLLLTAGYGFSHARYGATAENELGLKGAGTGDLLNYVPKHTFFTYGDYRFNRGMLRGLSLNYSVTYTDKIYRDFGRNLYYAPYTLLNLGANYTLKDTGLTFGLQADNVLNRVYIAQSLGTQPIPAEPRSIKLMLTYKIW